jgi:WhiB family transcriptional regulator, redox-sensing transcriptional regulator
MQIIEVQSPAIWGAFAACAETLDDVFFPAEDYKILPKHLVAANRYCGHCPVKRQCTQFALACDPDPGGIWGGMTPRERNKTRRNLLDNGVAFHTDLELDPEEFAPEPRTHLLARLAAEDREVLQEALRYIRRVQASVIDARLETLGVRPASQFPEPIQVTVSTSQVEWSLEVTHANVQPQIFPDPTLDLVGALLYLGIQLSNNAETYN